MFLISCLRVLADISVHIVPRISWPSQRSPPISHICTRTVSFLAANGEAKFWLHWSYENEKALFKLNCLFNQACNSFEWSWA